MLFWVPWHIMGTYFQPFAGGVRPFLGIGLDPPLKLQHVLFEKLEHVSQGVVKGTLAKARTRS
jgi:hypothetical protein